MSLVSYGHNLVEKAWSLENRQFLFNAEMLSFGTLHLQQLLLMMYF